MILNMSGGAKELAVKVVGGTVQPTGVAGMLWVETEPTIGAWTFDSVAPASPYSGDVWIEVSDRITAGINVLRNNTIIARVKRVWQYGTTWTRKNAYYYNTAWTQIAKSNTTYGIRWTYSASSPLLTRLEDAYGLTATASVGTTPGSSDFDEMPIYGDIRLCNLANNGTVNAYDGDPTFMRDGSNGQVMVEIPAFWVKVVDDTANSQYSYYITDAALDGYALHPMFQHNGTTQTHIYVAAYKTGSGYVSKTGVAPLVNQTRATTRSGIVSARGSRWGMVDVATRVGISMLIATEYATLNGQSAIGAGISGATGAHVSGEADGVAGTAGRASGTDNLSAVVWRGIENWWGNVWEWIDGFNVNGGVMYYCLTQASYADDTVTAYTSLGVTVGTAVSAAYATRLSATKIAVPTTFTGGSSTTYLCDACWTGTTWRTAAAGGPWDCNTIVGLWCWTWGLASSYSSAYQGSRLMYVPEAA